MRSRVRGPTGQAHPRQGRRPGGGVLRDRPTRRQARQGETAHHPAGCRCYPTRLETEFLCSHVATRPPLFSDRARQVPQVRVTIARTAVVPGRPTRAAREGPHPRAEPESQSRGVGAGGRTSAAVAGNGISPSRPRPRGRTVRRAMRCYLSLGGGARQVQARAATSSSIISSPGSRLGPFGPLGRIRRVPIMCGVRCPPPGLASRLPLGCPGSFRRGEP